MRASAAAACVVGALLLAGCGVQPDPAPVPIPSERVPDLTSSPTPSVTD